MMRNIYLYKCFACIKSIKKAFAFFVYICCCSFTSIAQCPPNIDFEQGNFTGWQCYSGSFFNTVVINPLPIPPTPGRHDLISAATVPAFDPWGNFPTLCPNGSGYSIRIGLQTTGNTADRVTYTFTIPPTQNNFSLIYNYAIVINNSGGHPPVIQPRLTISVRNLTNNTIDTCSSFDIAYSNANPLPGFQNAPSNPNVKFKPWAANSINLNGNAGNTIEISFTATGCGNSPSGSHFGYAYVDVNTQCSSSFVGAAYCPDDTTINVTAPFGYEFYKWWDITDPTVILANTQTINFTPPPPSGMTLRVALEPYDGYGCFDTLTVQLMDTLNVFANAGPDTLSCQNAPVPLGINSTPGFVYSWSPVAGLSNPNISNPVASPSVTTTYILTVRNFGGGCLTTDTVIVNAAVLDTALQVTGPLTGCITASNPTVLKVNPADSIQWYRNNIAIPGANDTIYNVVQTGTYHATVFSFIGCSLSTTGINITVNPFPAAGFTANFLNQCFNNHQFVFTNNSTIAFGTMQYNWDLGDGTTATTNNVTHSYLLPGTYIVKLLVTSDQGCADSISYTVNVYDSPVAGFNVNTNEQCTYNNQFIFTNTSTLAAGTMQYNWDLGDGNSTTSRDVTHIYALPGTYSVRLTVTTDKGCIEDSVFDVTVNPMPVVGFTEPIAQQCFGNNQFNFINNSTILTGTMQYAWTLGDGNTATTTDVTHSYAQPGVYPVKLIATSDKGCVDSSSVMTVKVFPYAKADFYVEPVCVNLRLPLTNKTINNTATPLNFYWDFGNGQTSSMITPVYSYPAAGTYTLSLTVNTNLCPQTLSVKQVQIVIDAPAIGIRYPEKDAVFNYDERLQARQIGSSVIWSPAISLSNRYSYSPYFRGINPQLYTIALKTLAGCVTVDTQFVKTYKKIEIYVPNAFTPGSNGLNDYLRPHLMGFVKVNYFRVYNRWGKLLFQMQSDKPGWDGRVKGQLYELQTVVWMIEAVDVDGKTHQRQGTTIILH